MITSHELLNYSDILSTNVYPTTNELAGFFRNYGFAIIAWGLAVEIQLGHYQPLIVTILLNLYIVIKMILHICQNENFVYSSCKWSIANPQTGRAKLVKARIKNQYQMANNRTLIHASQILIIYISMISLFTKGIKPYSIKTIMFLQNHYDSSSIDRLVIICLISFILNYTIYAILRLMYIKQL